MIFITDEAPQLATLGILQLGLTGKVASSAQQHFKDLEIAIKELSPATFLQYCTPIDWRPHVVLQQSYPKFLRASCFIEKANLLMDWTGKRITCHSDFVWIWWLRLNAQHKTFHASYSQSALQAICRKKLSELLDATDLVQALLVLVSEFENLRGLYHPVTSLEPNMTAHQNIPLGIRVDSAVSLDLEASQSLVDWTNQWEHWVASAHQINQSSSEQQRYNFAAPLMQLAVDRLPSLANAYQHSAESCSTAKRTEDGRPFVSFLFLRCPGFVFAFELVPRHWADGTPPIT
jgi:hypothetical protein